MTKVIKIHDINTTYKESEIFVDCCGKKVWYKKLTDS